MPQGTGDLLDQLVVQAIDQVAHVIFNVADVQVLPAGVTGVNDVHQIGKDIDNGVATGQGPVAEVIDPAIVGVGGNEGFGNFRKGFLEADVGGHGSVLQVVITLRILRIGMEGVEYFLQ